LQVNQGPGVVTPQPLNARTLAYWGERLPVPAYDRDLVTPGVVHFGVGGFHRAHQAMYHDRLMNEGIALDWGICGVGVMAAECTGRPLHAGSQAQRRHV
jgi:mannitol-1-phosphate/altronate dehydrogenase